MIMGKHVCQHGKESLSPMLRDISTSDADSILDSQVCLHKRWTTDLASHHQELFHSMLTWNETKLNGLSYSSCGCIHHRLPISWPPIFASNGAGSLMSSPPRPQFGRCHRPCHISQRFIELKTIAPVKPKKGVLVLAR